MLIITKDLSLFLCARADCELREGGRGDQSADWGNDLCSMHKGLAEFLNKRMNGGTE
jgi:hypothetical protein